LMLQKQPELRTQQELQEEIEEEERKINNQ
jgi:hypothetical protein